MKTQHGSGLTQPLMLNLGTRQKRMVSLTPWSLNPRRNIYRWYPWNWTQGGPTEQVWTFWRKKHLGPSRIRDFYLPFSESFTTATTTTHIMQLTLASSQRSQATVPQLNEQATSCVPQHNYEYVMAFSALKQTTSNYMRHDLIQVW